jgi:DNA-binding response OmpR family regulator
MKHVILVEDDPAIRDSLSIFFESKAIKLTTYHNGEAILSGDYVTPDLFLLDKQLSGVDGLEICRFLKSKEETRHVPVIMMSASPSVINQAALVAADDVLIKPYTLAQIQSILSEYL